MQNFKIYTQIPLKWYVSPEPLHAQIEPTYASLESL